MPEREMARRFSPLLLVTTSNQHLLEQCRAHITAPSYGPQSRIGSLFIGTSTVVFEPSDPSLPMLRAHFKDMPSVSSALVGPVVAAILEVHSGKAQEVESLDQQYTNLMTTQRWNITISDSMSVWAARLAELWAARTEDPTRFVDELRHNSRFDRTLLQRRERLLWLGEADEIQVLQRTPGHLAITNHSIVFQPCCRSVALPMRCTLVSDIRMALTKTYYRADCGLELFLDSTVSMLFLFETSRIRHHVLRVLRNVLDSPMLTDRRALAQAAFEAWWCHKMSNFEYILLLNFLANRSRHDLSAYPILPWVVQDYRSNSLDLTNPQTFRDLALPMGALTSDRLRSYQIRREASQDDSNIPDFLYGTHYASMAYVAHYVMRSHPRLMLSFNGGQLDVPDRMLLSVPNTWRSCTTNPTDVRELIPEFYVGDGGFLTDFKRVGFGKLQQGQDVGDVELPPWADTPQDFIRQNRKALESSFVSQHIHFWIDLIFGFRQTGPRAEEVHNIFHPMFFTSKPSHNWNQLDVSSEFGEMPLQVLTTPHPQRPINPEQLTDAPKLRFQDFPLHSQCLMQ